MSEAPLTDHAAGPRRVNDSFLSPRSPVGKDEAMRTPLRLGDGTTIAPSGLAGNVAVTGPDGATVIVQRADVPDVVAWLIAAADPDHPVVIDLTSPAEACHRQ